MSRFALMLLPFLLVACVSWPDVPTTQSTETAAYPTLLPLEQIGQPSSDLEREAATEEILARANGLRARANVLRRPVPDDDAMERLRQSLER